ncbi:MAG TPA: glyoxalase superfamily protein [Rhizobiaceae bacterium]|nr:glyoxalase superfamily protein [Rhizobiaceae bacterium]
MDTLSRSKSMAKALRMALADRHVDLPHSACLEIVARQFGFCDWNVMKATCDNEMAVTATIFVQHGREQEAVDFYRAAFNANLAKAYSIDDELAGVELVVGRTTFSVCGANPRREAEPFRGGPFFPKANGAVSTAFSLEVSDADAVLRKAMAAGAVVRYGLDVTDDGRRGASFFDPFGHIWGIVERASARKRSA